MYSPTEYWRNLHEREGLSAVGQSALPDEINDWIYRTIARNLRRFARRHRLVAPPGGRMLEVGVGGGYWLDHWRGLGWRVDGCDLVPAAVQRLQESQLAGRFWVADVGSPSGILAGEAGTAEDRYDLVTATSVLLHVTADDAFERALANVAAAVRPGGHLLLVEPVLLTKKKQAPFDPTRPSRARVLRSYRRPLRSHGLRLVAVEPATVLAANPLEAASPARLRRYQSWWKLVASTRPHPARARWVGPAMYALDWAAMRTGEAPTSKILLFRRSA